MNLTETIKAQMDEIKELKKLTASQAKTINDLTQTNKRLSGEVNDSNKYARALEKTWDGKSAPAVIDYSRMPERGLYERTSVRRIVRPDSMSRDIMFQIVVPEDWERIYGDIIGLSHWIERKTREILK
jgi:hypothetical protein